MTETLSHLCFQNTHRRPRLPVRLLSDLRSRVHGRLAHADTLRVPLPPPFAVLTRLLGKLLAAANAIFVVAISVIQFTGLLDNCWCDACIPSLGKKAGWVVLFASDAQITTASRRAGVGGVLRGIVVGGVASMWVFVARGDEAFGGGEL